MRPTLRPLSTLALLALAGATAARADEILLKNSKRLQGTAIALADGRVQVETSFGVLTLLGAAIDRIDRGESVREVARAALAELPAGDAAGRLALARWCQSEGATTLAKELMRQVIALEPDHAEARSALGYIRSSGAWLTEEEFHRRRGEVWFREAWVPVAERTRLLAFETARLEAEAARERADARAAELAAIERERREEAWAAAQRWQEDGCCAASWGSSFILLPQPQLPPKGEGVEPIPPRRPSLEPPSRAYRSRLARGSG